MPRSVYRGKVRDVIDAGDRLIMITSDRISAFDRPLGSISGKGEVLNQLAQYWFEQTSDLLENHVIEALGPRSTAVKKARMVPVEVVVRGYLTGSAWKEYSAGRLVPGLDVPVGMRAHQKLASPQITPTTKEAVGDHDQPIDRKGIVDRGLCSSELWDRIEAAALKLFARGQALLNARGLILVDTKYEFGVFEDRLILCDEVHTPDCSRFWFADDYQAAFSAGRNRGSSIKSTFGRGSPPRGFTGEGSIPPIPDEVFEETKRRYVEAFERITGQKFQFSGESFEAETQRILSGLERLTPLNQTARSGGRRGIEKWKTESLVFIHLLLIGRGGPSFLQLSSRSSSREPPCPGRMNVENLFDEVRDGGEYPEFDPDKGWTRAQFWHRCDGLAKVIRTLDGGPDILVLEEVEGAHALAVLKDRFLGDLGYRYSFLAPPTVPGVKTAFLSRFPLIRTGLLFPASGDRDEVLRPLVEAEFSLGTRSLVVVANHGRAGYDTQGHRTRQAGSGQNLAPAPG